MKIRSRIAAMALTAALALSPLAAPSLASPDDGKIVTTAHHIDAPKVYWRDNNFALLNEANGQTYALEDTVNWVGTGYKRSGEQLYFFNFEGSPNPGIDFIRSVGDLWYRAPAIPGVNKEPLWAGFGADSEIPTEQFRNASFSLDLVGFDGPGRMEALVYYADDDGVRRYLSSHDEGRRSIFLTPGNHTHNDTIFSKPGRYVLTYRATARAKDGSLIASKTVPFVWQVGGTRPSDTASTPLSQQFAAAPSGAPATPYTFTLSAHEGRQKDGDDKLTDLTFDAGDAKAGGNVTFFIDGYYLAQVPVVNGKATWKEMIGSTTSAFQAVYIPDAASGLPRWVSASVEYTTGEESPASTDSTQAVSRLPEPASSDPAPAFDTQPYTPKALSYTVDVKSISDSRLNTTITLSDSKVKAYINGGYYDSPTEQYPTCIFEGVTDVNGQLSINDSHSDCSGKYLRINVIPHALIGSAGGSADSPGPVDTRAGLSYSGSLAVDGASGTEPSPQPTPEPAPTSQPTAAPTATPAPSPTASAAPTATPAPSPTASAQPTVKPTAGPTPAPTSQPTTTPAPGKPTPTPPGASPAPTPTKPSGPVSEKVILQRGHVDIAGSLNADGTALSASLHDDTLTNAKTSVDRDINSVALALDDSARHTRPSSGRLAGSQYDFLGKSGSQFYYTDAINDGVHIWPGWSTNGISDSLAQGSVKFIVKPHSLPEGASAHVFNSDALTGKVEHIFNTSTSLSELSIPEHTHAHANWAFTKPGVYLFEVSFTATVKGQALASPTKCLTFLVGNQAIADYRAGKVSDCKLDGNSPGPGASPTNPTPTTPTPTAPINNVVGSNPTSPAGASASKPTASGSQGAKSSGSLSGALGSSSSGAKLGGSGSTGALGSAGGAGGANASGAGGKAGGSLAKTGFEPILAMLGAGLCLASLGFRRQRRTN